jgi:hypothetical protein
MKKTLRNEQMQSIENFTTCYHVPFPELFRILEKISLDTNDLFKKHIADDLIININKCIILCSKIFPEIRRSEPEFTLHDLRHSFNVINLMGQLIKNKEDLSLLEIGFLIYSALLHDIGMIDYDNGKISSEEIRANHGVRSAYLLKNGFLTEDSNVPFHFGTYHTTYQNYLPELCQSHTEDIAFIENFPRNLIVDDQKLDLLFCAITLRLADAMDMNNNRAPYSLYNLLQLNHISSAHWQKHMHITNCKIDENGYFRVDGSCEDITVFRMILKNFIIISEELRKSFSILLNNNGLLNLSVTKESINNQIQKKGFSIWDNKITLDYNSITKLFMGAQLYGNNRAGLREIIQNAIDACMVRTSMAKKYTLIEPHIPQISILYEDDYIYIIDNGTGMSKKIIENYFLNIGISYYNSPEFRDESLEYNPVGHFGIGFLSCFMLSNDIVVKTAHYDDAKEYHIHFIKEDSFVLIEEKQRTNFTGTEIRFLAKDFLNIFKRESEHESDFDAFKNIANYIKYHFWNLICSENIKQLKFNFNSQSFAQFSKEKFADKNTYIIDLSHYLNDVEGCIFMKDEEGLFEMWHNSNLKTDNFLISLKQDKLEINGTMKKTFPFCNKVLIFNGHKLEQLSDDDIQIYDKEYIIGFLGYKPYSDALPTSLTLIIHKDIFKTLVSKSNSTFYHRTFGYYEINSFRSDFKKALLNYCNTENIYICFLTPKEDSPYLTLINCVTENDLKEDLIELYLKSTRCNIFSIRKIWHIFCIKKIMINITNSKIEPQASRNNLVEESSEYLENALEIVKYLWLLENLQTTNKNANTISFVEKAIKDLWNSSNPLLKENFRPKYNLINPPYYTTE